MSSLLAEVAVPQVSPEAESRLDNEPDADTTDKVDEEPPVQLPRRYRPMGGNKPAGHRFSGENGNECEQERQLPDLRWEAIHDVEHGEDPSRKRVQIRRLLLSHVHHLLVILFCPN